MDAFSPRSRNPCLALGFGLRPTSHGPLWYVTESDGMLGKLVAAAGLDHRKDFYHVLLSCTEVFSLPLSSDPL